MKFVVHFKFKNPNAEFKSYRGSKVYTLTFLNENLNKSWTKSTKDSVKFDR
ncbi:hypothetical protein CC1G_15093 [Coprinopsis cinerea okayama7|uniref:Uncharacterized protein n=1 Tax=Coprinopsis cinerea (strain Okayama-7 / 130 / ATCC MYA-4618 / FGSC 9003) TaxID=240176 RepID=D6RPG0_COPC7|nr:hypothetical protein CC1G_15093 [Coprinopsis cinerea okayama7\|eukprot:XP_002910759.1 hypothetical protein CC1G_15093 [Coprinopsis cinerea okayama7\